jgi:hypothetical protein
MNGYYSLESNGYQAETAGLSETAERGSCDERETAYGLRKAGKRGL